MLDRVGLSVVAAALPRSAGFNKVETDTLECAVIEVPKADMTDEEINSLFSLGRVDHSMNEWYMELPWSALASAKAIDTEILAGLPQDKLVPLLGDETPRLHPILQDPGTSGTGKWDTFPDITIRNGFTGICSLRLMLAMIPCDMLFLAFFDRDAREYHCVPVYGGRPAARDADGNIHIVDVADKTHTDNLCCLHLPDNAMQRVVDLLNDTAKDGRIKSNASRLTHICLELAKSNDLIIDVDHKFNVIYYTPYGLRYDHAAALHAAALRAAGKQSTFRADSYSGKDLDADIKSLAERMFACHKDTKLLDYIKGD